MKYFFLSLLLLLIPTVAMSETTGLFYDSERSGEGIMVMRDERRIVTYFYTYGDSDCDKSYTPDVGPVLQEYYDCTQQGQRWFFGVDNWNEVDEEATGFLFMTAGYNYPEGIPKPTNPFGVDIGEAIAVGVYIMRPAGDGYQMLIVPYGDTLAKDDPLYGRIYQFTDLLFAPLGAEPR